MARVPLNEKTVRRALLIPVICSLASTSVLAGAPSQRIEMDVLEMNEAPAQAVRRMDDKHQATRKRRRGSAEHPGVGSYVPEALGDRGLMIPVGMGTPGVPRDGDRHDGRGNDREHDKDRGEGHDVDHVAGHDKDHGKDHDKDHDKGQGKDHDKGHDKGHGKDHGKGPGGG